MNLQHLIFELYDRLQVRVVRHVCQHLPGDRTECLFEGLRAFEKQACRTNVGLRRAACASHTLVDFDSLQGGAAQLLRQRDVRLQVVVEIEFAACLFRIENADSQHRDLRWLNWGAILQDDPRAGTTRFTSPTS